MAIRAGVGLPGPFFLTFPIVGPVLGLMFLPVFFMWYCFVGMYYMLKYMGIAFYLMALGTIWFFTNVVRPAATAAMEWHEDRKQVER